MNQLDRRIEALEKPSASDDPNVVIVIGTPTARDIERMRTASVVVHLPSNGRDDHERTNHDPR